MQCSFGQRPALTDRISSIKMENSKQSTETDFWSWNNNPITKVIIKEIQPERGQTQGQSDRIYNMNHKNRGVALIFNHLYFHSMRTRKGTEVDKKSIIARLKALRFEVRNYDDLKFKDILGVVNNLVREDHSDNDCLLVVVMSHGDERDQVYANDKVYNLNNIMNILNSCSTLQGKPKMYFIQSCRGEEMDFGVKIAKSETTPSASTYHRTRTFTDGASIKPVEAMRTSYVVPTSADTLIMRATYEGYYSWRHPDKGSWFIQSLCRELENYDPALDLVTILTFVNRHVALEYESFVPDDPSMHAKKQVCTLLSTLRRLVYFPSRLV